MIQFYLKAHFVQILFTAFLCSWCEIRVQKYMHNLDAFTLKYCAMNNARYTSYLCFSFLHGSCL